MMRHKPTFDNARRVVLQGVGGFIRGVKLANWVIHVAGEDELLLEQFGERLLRGRVVYGRFHDSISGPRLHLVDRTIDGQSTAESIGHFAPERLVEGDGIFDEFDLLAALAKRFPEFEQRRRSEGLVEIDAHPKSRRQALNPRHGLWRVAALELYHCELGGNIDFVWREGEMALGDFESVEEILAEFAGTAIDPAAMQSALDQWRRPTLRQRQQLLVERRVAKFRPRMNAAKSGTNPYQCAFQLNP